MEATLQADEHLNRVLAFGEEVSSFLQTDVGVYLIQCADKEIETASNSLHSVSPWRRNRIRELQNQVWRAQSFKRWLSDAISAGQKARAILEDESDGA